MQYPNLKPLISCHKKLQVLNFRTEKHKERTLKTQSKTEERSIKMITLTFSYMYQSKSQHPIRVLELTLRIIRAKRRFYRKPNRLKWVFFPCFSSVLLKKDRKGEMFQNRSFSDRIRVIRLYLLLEDRFGGFMV